MKEILDGLKQWLEDRKDRWVSHDSFGGGDSVNGFCSTDYVNMESLNDEIDAFGEFLRNREDDTLRKHSEALADFHEWQEVEKLLWNCPACNGWFVSKNKPGDKAEAMFESSARRMLKKMT